MKNSNIFLLFLVTLLVIIGNEVAIATRVGGGGDGGKKCKVGTFDTPQCVPQTCFFQCDLKYGNPVVGQCENGACICYGPC
ncbi:unnamed protein product [Linum tenue]|uniref:Defensin-like protein n=1 Tax=Linum tenue TaxID=586396 RepID=A0AAV0RHQ6_9ROSI|nr:unnamed protein product [Linum tenue]